MKKNNSGFKRTLSVMLAFSLLAIPMTACGDNGSGAGGNEEGLSEFVYVPEYTSIPEEVMDINNPYLSGDVIYFSSNAPMHADGTIATQEEVDAMYAMYSSDDSYRAAASSSDVKESATAEVAEPAKSIEPDITYKNLIYAINKDGTNYHQLEEYVPYEATDDYSYASLDRLIADSQGCVWVAESVSHTVFDLPEGFDSNTEDPWQYYVDDERQSFIRKLSDTGTELCEIDLSQYVEVSEETEGYGGSFYINDMIADDSGNVYITDGDNTVYVIGPDATFLFKVSVENWLNSLVLLKDGTVGVTTNSQDGNSVIKMVDVSAKDWGKEYVVPSDVWNTSDGGEAYDFCYTDSSSLFGYNLETAVTEKILTWLNCDVDGDNVRFSTVLADGNVFAISRDYSDDGETGYEIITMVKTPRSEVVQKTTLTMATMWMDYNIRKELFNFNKTNPDYRIEITDYSEYNTEDDYNAGITKLNTEIISGKVPDIIDISNLPYKQYAAKGLLEDLYTYIDNDPDIERDDLMPGVIKAIETDGKLYQLVSSFGALSIVGASSIVGDDMGWTMDEMQEIINNHPEADYPFGMYMTRENILQVLCMLNMENYMDWQTGECSFNSDEFKKLLSFANTFPETVDYSDGEWVDTGTLIQDGRQMFEIFSASDFQNYQYYKAMFGGSITFKGFPSDSGSGNVAQINGGLAMTSSCDNKDGAWQFMRILLSDDYQEGLDWYFPISKKAFDKQLAEAMKQEYTTDENGDKIPISRGGMSIGDGPMIEFYAITQDEANQIKELIDSVDHTVVYDENLLNIINEEAAYYFAGEKTVDQTADIIQSRMTIYINEQR